MNIKNDFTIEKAVEKLKGELSSHIKVKLRRNVINSDKKWIDIDQNAFVGIRVSFYSDGVSTIKYVPNFFARIVFGGLISGLFHSSSRTKLKNQIESFLISEYYE
jgi:hypothetical protein|tara:strand:+ start:1166 stop:1480 length:315 start_codon:yes stop_codon:yes gene_type:complete